MPIDCLQCRYVGRRHSIGTSGPPEPPPPPPPPPQSCYRIATNQRGPLASLIEPTILNDQQVFGQTSGATGKFKFFAYSQYTTAPGEITWTYTVNLPSFDTSGLQDITFLPAATWATIQSSIDTSSLDVDDADPGGQGVRIRVPASLRSVSMPEISINGRRRVWLDFSLWNNAPGTYTGGDSNEYFINIDRCDEVKVTGFRMTCSGGNRKRGIRVDESTDVDILTVRLSGCTDGIIFPNGANNTRVRLLSVDSLGNTQNSLSTDLGYGAYLGDTTDLTIDTCTFEAGDGSGEHALRIPNPTRLKLVDSLFRVSLASAQKRCLWVFGATQAQITNCTAVNNEVVIGITEGTTGGANNDNQGGPTTTGVRIDGLTITNCVENSALSVKCGGFGTTGANGGGRVRDVAMRNLTFNNPANAARCIIVEWRDRNDLSRDIVWLPSTCLVDGAEMASTNWRISSDWTAQEALDRNIGPAVGVTEYQQYIVFHNKTGNFTDNEVLTMNGVVNASYKSRSAANGGVSQVAVSCATGVAAGETILLVLHFPPSDPPVDSQLYAFDTSAELDQAAVDLYESGVSGPDVVTNIDNGTTAFIIELLVGTPGRIVVAKIEGDGFTPSAMLQSPALDAAGLSLSVGSPTNLVTYP